MVIEPARSFTVPLPEQFLVPRERISPRSDRNPAFVIHCHCTIRNRDRRALLKKPGIIPAPAFVPLDRPVDTRIRPPGQSLQVQDRELVAVAFLDYRERVSLLGSLQVYNFEDTLPCKRILVESQPATRMVWQPCMLYHHRAPKTLSD